MWVSNQLLNKGQKNNTAVSGNVVSASGNVAYVSNSEEYRDIPIVAPYGITYVPPPGSKAVVIPIENSAVLAGIIPQGSSLEPGELMLYSSGGASIVLKNNGDVLINGTPISS